MGNNQGGLKSIHPKLVQAMMDSLNPVKLQATITQLKSDKRVLVEALEELLKYNSKTVWTGGVENGALCPVGGALLLVIEKAEQAFTQVREDNDNG